VHSAELLERENCRHDRPLDIDPFSLSRMHIVQNSGFEPQSVTEPVVMRLRAQQREAWVDVLKAAGILSVI